MRPARHDDEPTKELAPEIRQHLTRYKAPPGLERRIRHMVAQEARRPGLVALLRTRIARWMPLGVSFACGVLLATSVALVGTRPWRDDPLEAQVVAGHVRSLMAAHLVDVASSDRHTVKPWFLGKLDFAPPVIDLGPQGFPLVGGRLDYVGGRPAAALVYQRRGHTINVFVLPARHVAAARPTFAAKDGYQVAQWEAGDMRFWAVSDLARDELQAFAAALRAAP